MLQDSKKPLEVASSPSATLLNLENLNSVLAQVDFTKLSNLATELGLETELGEIEAETDPGERRECLAKKWLQKYQAVASWDSLVSALRSPLVGENWLSSSLKKKYLQSDSWISTHVPSTSQLYSPQSQGFLVSDNTNEKGNLWPH